MTVKARIVRVLLLITYTDYTALVLAIMAIFGVINWFAWARKNFHGPRIDAGHAQTVDIVMNKS